MIRRPRLTLVASAAVLAVSGSAMPPAVGADAPAPGRSLLAYTSGIDVDLDGSFGAGTAEEDGTDVWVRDLARGTTPILVNRPNSVADVNPSFSPDGTRIAWASRDSGNGTLDILVKNLATGAITNVTNTGEGINERWPSWSPDSKQIVYNRRTTPGSNLDIWIMNADGSGRRFVTGKIGDGKFFEDCCATFTKDGRALVFASNRTGQFDIYRFDLPGPGSKGAARNVTRLTYAPWYQGTPFVEAKGTVVYRNGADQQIYRLDPYLAPGLMPVAIRVPGEIRTPQGTSDGRGLVFGWREHGEQQLDIVITDRWGANPLNVTRSPIYSETNPTFQPNPR